MAHAGDPTDRISADDTSKTSYRIYRRTKAAKANVKANDPVKYGLCSIFRHQAGNFSCFTPSMRGKSML